MEEKTVRELDMDEMDNVSGGTSNSTGQNDKLCCPGCGAEVPLSAEHCPVCDYFIQ